MPSTSRKTNITFSICKGPLKQTRTAWFWGEKKLIGLGPIWVSGRMAFRRREAITEKG